MRHPQASGDSPASRRWTTAIVAALVLHVCGLWITAQWTPPAPPPLDPLAYKVELVRLPPARPKPKRVTHVTARPVPKHVVLQPSPPRPVTRTAAPPRRVHLNMAKTQFHHVVVAAPLTTTAGAPRPPVVAAAQPANVAPAPADAPVTAAAAPAQPAPAASAPPAVPANPNAVPNWQGLLAARLAQFKRYPPGARGQQGMPYLRFTLDRHGNVVTASIYKSSGVDVLDAEALALVRRAAPFPAPPPEVTDEQLTLIVPINYYLRAGF